MPNGHEPKAPHPPKCRACKEQVGVIGSRSLPAEQRESVRRGGKHYHPDCLPASGHAVGSPPARRRTAGTGGGA